METLLYDSIHGRDDHAIEFLTEKVGFRKLEIKDGLAMVNGVAVDFMGVNKHEHHPRFGRTDFCPSNKPPRMQSGRRYGCHLQ